jgi:hypothetical protein
VKPSHLLIALAIVIAIVFYLPTLAQSQKSSFPAPAEVSWDRCQQVAAESGFTDPPTREGLGSFYTHWVQILSRPRYGSKTYMVTDTAIIEAGVAVEACFNMAAHRK